MLNYTYNNLVERAVFFFRPSSVNPLPKWIGMDWSGFVGFFDF